jgi:tetratricopeptide (TPR) repeat protein
MVATAAVALSEPAAPRSGAPVLAIERGGARFVWPDLDAPCYADPDAAVERLALKGWRHGGMTPNAPGPHTSAAGRYLAADVMYLRTLMGQIEPLDAIAAYERALRADPGFPDAPRALLMIGFASLHLRLAPEADTAFVRLLASAPAPAHASLAHLGRAMALRLRRRFDAARASLARVRSPALRCHVAAEQAALARAEAAHAAAVAFDEVLARDCPGFQALCAPIEERADSLLVIGRRAEARALLERPGETLDADGEAAALVRAAELAREDGDLESTRRALERALGLRIGPATRLRIQARLVRLDAVVSPERAVAGIEALLATAPTVTARLDGIGVLVDTLADAGRFEQALARLEAPDARAVDGEARLTIRDAVLARWIARTAAAGDLAGVAEIYGRYRATVETRSTGATARLVADALGRLGLARMALRLLRLRDRGEEPAHALALAEAALAAGEVAEARAALSRIDDGTAPSAALQARRAALAARLDGDASHPERPTGDADFDPARLAGLDDPVVRRALALLAMTRAFGPGRVGGTGEMAHDGP